MKYFLTILLSLTITKISFSQESKIRLLDSKKWGENFAIQTFELLIFNNTKGPICLKGSSTFGEKVLSSDTIELTNLELADTIYYSLGMSEENAQIDLNDYFYYPLVLNPRTCFSTIVRITRKLNIDYRPWIEFSYINQTNVNYCEFEKLYRKHILWHRVNDLKFYTRKILLPSQ